MSTKKSWPFMTEKEEQQQIDAWGFCARVITPEIQERYGLRNVDSLHSLVITSLEDSNNHEYKRQNDNEDFELQIGDVLTSLNGGEIEVSEGKSAYEIILSRISRYKKNAGPNKPIKLCLRLKRKDENTNEYKEIEVLSKFTFDDNNLPKEKVIVDKTVMAKNVLSVLVLCLFILVSSAFAANDDKYVILDVEGEGANRASAMDSAWLEGIRQAAGSFIYSKTELNDDKLTERIISYSRGLVEKYEIISVDDSKVSDGIYKLKMRMWIVKEILRDGTRHATANSSEISFSVSDLKRTKEDDIDANAIEKHDVAAETVKRKAQTAAEILEAMLGRYNPEDFLSCYIPGKPEPVKDKQDFFTLNVEINFNEKLYKEAFIPDLIQVLDQIASAKKNSLLMKNKNELRALNTEQGAPRAWNNSSIILRANGLGKDYSVAIYNKPENFGCRLYAFAEADANNVLNYRSGAFAKFFGRTQQVKGLVVELLDEDGETIETIEKRFDIAFLLTNGNKAQNVWSVQPTMMIHYPERDRSVVPEGVILSQKGIIADPDDLTITLSFMNNNYNLRLGYNSSVIDEKSEYFPFTISPEVSSKGQWSNSSDGSNRGEYTFSAKTTSLKMNTLYQARTKNKFLRELLGDAIGPSATPIVERNKKEFSFQTTAGWEEKASFTVPVEIEMPEEVLQVIRRIRASLLLQADGTAPVNVPEPEPISAPNKPASSASKPWLGVSVRDLTPEIAEHYDYFYDFKGDDGALLVGVANDSPASKAGLKEGYIILKIGGKDVIGAKDVVEIIKTFEVGNIVEITAFDLNKEKVFRVKIEERPAK